MTRPGPNWRSLGLGPFSAKEAKPAWRPGHNMDHKKDPTWVLFPPWISGHTFQAGRPTDLPFHPATVALKTEILNGFVQTHIVLLLRLHLSHCACLQVLEEEENDRGIGGRKERPNRRGEAPLLSSLVQSAPRAFDLFRNIGGEREREWESRMKETEEDFLRGGKREQNKQASSHIATSPSFLSLFLLSLTVAGFVDASERGKKERRKRTEIQLQRCM